MESKARKRKLQVLTVDERLKVIEQHEIGRRVSEIAAIFGLPQSTVSTIIKNKDKWIQKKRLSNDPLKRKIRKVVDSRLERSMELRQARTNNFPLSGAIIQEKAREFAQQLGVTNFKGSAGWLTKIKKLCGESRSVDIKQTDDWIEALPSIIRNYEPSNIYNADETGLFYKCLPDKTYALQSETCHGGKYSKQRLTIMCAANMDGSEKFPLLVIGKSKKPRCFKNVKSLPVIYESNSKAWMTSALFEKWITDLDQKFASEGRKVLLFVDNCSAHPKAVQEKLQAIELKFFPPVLQPLDLGIIKNLKHYYRHTLVKQRLCEMENNSESSDITVLDAINIIARAWSEDVKPETVANCFRKAGFTIGSHSLELHDSNIDDELDELDIPVPFATYCAVDENVLTSSLMTDEDIIESVMEENLEESVENDESFTEAPQPIPTFEVNSESVRQNLLDMHAILQVTDHVPAEIYQKFYSIERLLMKQYC